MSDSGGPIGPTRRPDKVPPALRPGETDDVLEGPRLTRISLWGLGMSLLVALFIFFYWVHEPTRMTNATAFFDHNQVLRGQQYFYLPTDPKTGLTNTRGIGCARCHGNGNTSASDNYGDNADGGTNTYIDSTTGKSQTAVVPNLTGVFARYANPAKRPGYKTALAFIQSTIEQGRTNGVIGDGDDMPTWLQKYGGPLTDQQISDILAYLQTIQKPVKAPSPAPSAAAGTSNTATSGTSNTATSGTTTTANAPGKNATTGTATPAPSPSK